MQINYGQLFNTFKKQMTVEEQDNFLYVIKYLKDWSTLDWLLVQNQEVTESDSYLFQDVFEKLQANLSPQYITGVAEFRDLHLSVDKRVLIPRLETEELVQLILDENPIEDLTILDIGTGSGAIALSLKLERPSWQITASDISEDALDLAKKNAKKTHLEVTFCQSDVFDTISGQFDIVVSNPPYISYEDKDEVADNVLASEPYLALFATEDGYNIYRRLIEEVAEHLTIRGKLYFEIGYKQGNKIKEMLEEYFPAKRVRVLKDQFNQDRMVVMDNG